MLSIGNTILRAANFVFLIIALGLTGSLAGTTVTQSNLQVNFGIFASVFGLLTSSFYGVLAFFFDAFAWPIILATFDLLNTLFTFAAATAIADAIHVHSCSNRDYLDDNRVCQGSKARCHKAQASTAFLYFSFFVFLTSSVLSIVAILRDGAFSVGGRKKFRVGVPGVSVA